MRVQEFRDLLGNEFDFPVERGELVEEFGDISLEDPRGKDDECLADVLERSGTQTYGTVDELYDSIVGNLGEEHVGRKSYDDRGPNHGDDADVSF